MSFFFKFASHHVHACHLVNHVHSFFAVPKLSSCHISRVETIFFSIHVNIIFELPKVRTQETSQAAHTQQGMM